MWRRISLVTGLAVSLTLVCTAQTSAVTASFVHEYAGQSSGTTRVQGIDGYIRTSTSVTLSATQGHAHFFNLSPTSAFSAWVQGGQYQGSVWSFTTLGSRTTVREYIEWNSSQCGYGGRDLGTRARLNEAYYLTAGSAQTHACDGDLLYPIFFRIGTWGSPPAASAYLAYSTNYPIAETELLYDVTTEGRPPVGTDQYGLDDSGNVNASYGLHVLKSGAWNLWTSAVVPGTAAFEDSPPYYGSRAAYSAFQTRLTP